MNSARIKNKIATIFSHCIRSIRSRFAYFFIAIGAHRKSYSKINLCSGPILLPGYCNIDVSGDVDLLIDMAKHDLPFQDGTIDTLVCISAINYFTRERGAEIIKDVHRVLASGGVARFATQDLRAIAEKYVAQDKEFFFQRLPDGRERFTGTTMADKINAWFYGYPGGAGTGCRYFYDYETLALLFTQAGFSVVERKAYRESRIPDIELIDNRDDQMFFLEAIK